MAAFVASLIDPISNIIDRILPDKSQAAAAKAQLIQLQANGEIQQILGQIQIDNTEAASKSWLAANWRPSIGMVCGAAFAYSFVIQPFLQFILVAFHVNFDPSKLPTLNMSDINTVLLGMLGLASAHAFENVTAIKNK
ncbi:MAG TPA: 3TM-type holin [Ktedonobacteraceae bacterium]